MDDESPPRVAADRAWTIYLAAHADVDAADHRRCTLERLHVFRYPNVPEMATAYPDDPDVAPLLSAAEKLVDGLYDPCKAA